MLRASAWLLALAALAAIASLGIAYKQRYNASLQAVQQTLAVEESANDALALLRDAETGQRGFLLTGQSEFLAPYASVKQALSRQLQRLQALTAKSQEQNDAAVHVSVLARAKMDELDETIRLRRQGRSDEALAIVQEGRGRRLMDSARSEIATLLARDHAELAGRQAEAERGLERLANVLFGSWALLALVVGASVRSATRRIAETKRAAESIASSARAVRAVAENASDLVRIINDRAELVYVSPSCERILGFTRAEMLAMPPRGLLHEDEREPTRQLTLRVHRGEEIDAPHVHRLRTKAGVYRWFETSFRSVRDGDAVTSQIHLTSRDITERRAAEQALREQTSQLRSILASMGDGVVVFSLERQVVAINARARYFVPWNAGERISREWAEQNTFLLDGITPCPVEQAPMTRALLGEPADDAQLVVRATDGALRTVSVNARPIYDDTTLVGCVAVLRDITERRRAEQELQESEERLRVLSNASFDGVAITSGRRIVDVNQTLAGWVGRTREELVGADGLFLFEHDDREQVRTASTESGSYEARLLRRDGAPRPVEVRGSFTTFRGESVRIAVIRDITDRLQREAALKEHGERMRSRSLRDELTDLYNRRGFLEIGAQALRTLARAGSSGCVFFADLDGLKAINDELGHEAGDQAIVAAAKLLCGVFRESDVVARLGGDEFGVLALDCGSADISGVLIRIAESLEAQNRSGAAYRLSISIGMAPFEAAAKPDLATLMDVADRAMYERKRRFKASMRPA